ncbi:MAG: hypothetical protein JWO62_1986 [Acidimicrobiaceae bacterium]|nr:hypothetical protein [Acidimicrobiaceae bacterium]
MLPSTNRVVRIETAVGASDGAQENLVGEEAEMGDESNIRPPGSTFQPPDPS